MLGRSKVEATAEETFATGPRALTISGCKPNNSIFNTNSHKNPWTNS